MSDENIAPETDAPKAPALKFPPEMKETEAPAPSEEDAPDQPEAAADVDESEDDESQDTKPKKPMQERFGQIYGRMKQAERERDALAQQLESYRQPLVTPEQWEEMSYDEQQAVQIRSAVREEKATELETQLIRQQREADMAAFEGFQARVEDFAQSAPEVMEALSNPNLMISETAARLILQSEKGPQLALELHRDSALSNRIASLPPIQQALEIGRLEGKIQTKSNARKITQAPPPVKTVATGGGANAKDLTNMSFVEYEAYRKKSGA